ncbi:MAG: glycogen/starch synthase, partial [Patescibacteria group bacterium]|nr:glycogen/starch synthase [Patescibacteria group bacterium]
EANYVFELSWEACNKVGGIFTVLKSKSNQMMKFYSNYYLVGPYFPEQTKGSFKEQPVPKEFQNAFKELKEQGIECHFGEWLIAGKPKTILIDFQSYWSQINQIKTDLWKDYKIDSLETGHDFDEPVLWSHVTGMLLKKIEESLGKKKIVAHFHEWLSGAGLLYLKKHNSKIGTVFTTHATTLGRTLSGHSINFYPILKKINIEGDILKYKIQAKHGIEKAAAEQSNVFTTVSEITAIEAEQFLGRKPEVLLPNGLDIEKFLTLEEVIIKHRIQRDRLKEFLLYYFFPYYTFDLKNVLFYFIVGRYEFRAKGADILIESLGKLNKKLIKSKSKKTIVTFFWIPTATERIKPEILKNKELFEDIKDALEDISKQTERNILSTLSSGKSITEKSLFREDFLLEMERKLMKLKVKGLPPLSTHDLINKNDSIIEAFHKAGLENKKTDKVKVIFYPMYLTGHDSLANLSYHESIQASHLGIFPSFYEPWGYTPLEAAVLGVSSVTADLAGFGKFCQTLKRDKQYPGIFILERLNKTNKKVAESLTEFLYHFSKFNRADRVKNRIEARKIASVSDWKIFVKNYITAHNKALGNKEK